MTKTFRSWMTAMVMAGGLIGAAQTTFADQQINRPAVFRVRSSHPTITPLIATGIDQSPTFRGIVETINASDGIVYVEEGRCGGGVHACLKGVTVSGSNRIVLVWIELRRGDHDLIATIGHELRHTIEVLSNPGVTTSAAMYIFYRREGLGRPAGTFETAAAIEAGDAVHAELRQEALRRAR